MHPRLDAEIDSSLPSLHRLEMAQLHIRGRVKNGGNAPVTRGLAAFQNQGVIKPD